MTDGVRARIGLIIPSGNQLTEPQFQRYAPAGTQVHVTRLRMTGAHRLPLPDLLPRAVEAACCLADARCDAIVFHCTANAMAAGIEGGRRLVAALQKATGRICLTTATAVLAAFQVLDARRIVLLSPYGRASQEEELAFLAQAGIEVLRERALGVSDFPAVPAERWLELALEEDDPAADACFLSCTNIHSLPVLDQIERRLGRPAVASNQATLWYCLRALGIDDPVPGLGRLFATAAPLPVAG